MRGRGVDLHPAFSRWPVDRTFPRQRPFDTISKIDVGANETNAAAAAEKALGKTLRNEASPPH